MLPWLSGDKRAQPLLDTFARGEDVYIRQAAMMFGVQEADVTKDNRQAGKVTILACGYQGAVNALQSMARAYGMHIDDETARRWVDAWRRTNPWAPVFWRKLEDAATKAVKRPGEAFVAGRVSYCSDGNQFDEA